MERKKIQQKSPKTYVYADKSHLQKLAMKILKLAKLVNLFIPIPFGLVTRQVGTFDLISDLFKIKTNFHVNIK